MSLAVVISLVVLAACDSGAKSATSTSAITAASTTSSDTQITNSSDRTSTQPSTESVSVPTAPASESSLIGASSSVEQTPQSQGRAPLSLQEIATGLGCNDGTNSNPSQTSGITNSICLGDPDIYQEIATQTGFEITLRIETGANTEIDSEIADIPADAGSQIVCVRGSGFLVVDPFGGGHKEGSAGGEDTAYDAATKAAIEDLIMKRIGGERCF